MIHLAEKSYMFRCSCYLFGIQCLSLVTAVESFIACWAILFSLFNSGLWILLMEKGTLIWSTVVFSNSSGDFVLDSLRSLNNNNKKIILKAYVHVLFLNVWFTEAHLNCTQMYKNKICKFCQYLLWRWSKWSYTSFHLPLINVTHDLLMLPTV